MKCHYEVLDVPRDADEAVIKTAYKKLALKWHPDKNLNNPDEAKEQFQFVQQAYEVLSDRQERAWYDNHREQILHGSNKDFEDKNLDVFQYFTTSCFKGYNDDDSGFYTVYRKVFEDIAKEDMEYLDEKEDFCNIPMFGSSTSDYEAVGMFYSYWSAYSTKKSYVWVDPYDIKDIRHRKLLKLVEKDNKKARIKAKKERNEEVRNLVAFVRKRDKRVIANTKKLEAKVIENREKQKEISKQKRIEKQKSNMENTQAEWTKFDNVKAELEEIEKSLVEEFGRDSSMDESDEELDNLYCAACNKIFKTPKAFENHESSKKHKENVEFLKEYLQEEEDKLKQEGDDDEDNIDEESDEGSLEETEEIIVEDATEIKSNSSQKNSSNDELSSEETFVTIESKSKKKNRKVKNTIKPEIIEEPDHKVNEVNSQESDEDFKFSVENTKKQKKKNRKKDTKPKDTTTANVKDEVMKEATNVKDDFEEDIKTKKANKRKKERGKNVPQDIAEMDKDHCCVACKAEFNSKNKLFDHLKKTGHSTYLPPTTSKNKSRTLK